MIENSRFLQRVAHIAALLSLVAAVIAGALGGGVPRVAMAQDGVLGANKRLVAALYDEIINNRNYEAALDAVAPGIVEHRREGDVTYETPEDFVTSTAEEIELLPPDLQVTINYQIAEGEQVVNHLTLTLADSGATVNGMSIFRVVNGKVIEMEEIIDELSLLTQLGLMPDMGEEATMTEEVIAEGFNGPMGVLLDADGNVWVVDSGIGGEEEMTMPNPETGEEDLITIGDSSRIVMIAPDGTQTDIATLPSVLQGGEGSGGSRLAVLDGVLYATSGGWLEGIPVDRMPLMAAVVAVNEDGSVEEITNTWDFEATENPDGFVLESHPYGLAAGADGLLWVADAGANTVYTVDPESGEISLVATIDGVASPLPNPARGCYGDGLGADGYCANRRWRSVCFVATWLSLLAWCSKGRLDQPRG